MTNIEVTFTGSVSYFTEEPDPSYIPNGVKEVGSLDRLTGFVEQVVALSATIPDDPDLDIWTIVANYLNPILNSYGFHAIVNDSTSSGKTWVSDGQVYVHSADPVDGALEFVSDGDGGSWQVAIRCTVD
jgi:hypothetical protein